jgi:hypothetical protein
VTGAPWTIGTALAFTGTTANGAPTATVLRSGFAHGPASGTTSPANLGGVVQLVTPAKVVTNLGTEMIGPLFGILTIHFVPEPSTILLVGGGLGLLALGRRGRQL